MVLLPFTAYPGETLVTFGRMACAPSSYPRAAGPARFGGPPPRRGLHRQRCEGQGQGGAAGWFGSGGRSAEAHSSPADNAPVEWNGAVGAAEPGDRAEEGLEIALRHVARGG
jgi:hypothetical protein